jgi:hypothetical protein
MVHLNTIKIVKKSENHSESKSIDISRILRSNILKSVLIITTIFALIIILQAITKLEPFDDAYITFRYARNISEGAGFVYNQGEKVLGTTTPLYTLLLAAIACISNPGIIPQASYWISLTADAVNVLLIFHLARWLFKDLRIAVFCTLVFFLHPFRINVASGGMETSLFLTALLTMYYCYYVRERKAFSATAAACAVFIRPDALLAVFPLIFAWFIQDRKGTVKALAIFTMLLLPWVIWATWYFGSPLPHSIIAKSITYKNPLGYAAYYLLTFLGSGTIGPYLSPLPVLSGLVLAIPVLAVGLRAIANQKPYFLAAALYPPLYCFVMSIINPAMYFSWYFPPLLPGILLIFFSAVWFIPVQRPNVKYLLSTILSLLLLTVPTVLHQTHPSWPLSRAREKAFWQACDEINKKVGKQTTILAPDIGVLGWCLGDATILDPIGLIYPQALDYSSTLPPDQLISSAMIVNKVPDYIISLDQYIHPAIRQDGFLIKSYTPIYERDVTIIDQTQPLYILKYHPDN